MQSNTMAGNCYTCNDLVDFFIDRGAKYAELSITLNIISSANNAFRAFLGSSYNTLLIINFE